MKKHAEIFKKQSISAYQVKARPGWRVDWYDRKGKRRTASCGTRDDTEAKAVALDLERMVNDPSAYDSDPESRRMQDFHPKSRQIFFDLEQPPAAPKSIMSIQVENYSVGEQEFSQLRVRDGEVSESEQQQWFKLANHEADGERKDRLDNERKVAQLEREKKSWEQERLGYLRRLNDHCDVTLDGALKAFESHYKPDHDPHTVKQVVRVNRELADTIGGDSLVGEVSGSWINDYLDDYGDGDAGLATRRKVRAYVSTFWTWAVRQYQLNGNPMAHVHSISATSPEKILAFRDWKAFESYLEALKPWPYWRAWVAFATLAGPRWWEQARVKVSDLHADLGYVRIFARKTGKERNVPIERKVLRPILEDYLEKHWKLAIPRMKKKKDEDFPWLFPSPHVGHGARGDGVWRASTWHKHWGGGRNPKGWDGKPGKIIVGVREQAATKSKEEWWMYGPAEWRHCAGTAMGHSGVSSLRISQWLGNSEAVCRAHYIAPVGANDWPLSWGGE